MASTLAELQESLCYEILQKINYYEILGVKPDCDIELIKKAYKSLALKVHPDKNRSESAREAFQKISKAFVCLSSEKLRKIYDLTGSEDVVDSNVYQKFDADFADKVFKDLVSEGKVTQQPLYRSYLTKCLLLQLLPVFLILFICMHTTNIQNRYEFSLFITPHYNMKKVTKEMKIEYYVNNDFYRNIGKVKAEELEKDVEHFYLITRELRNKKQEEPKNQEEPKVQAPTELLYENNATEPLCL